MNFRTENKIPKKKLKISDFFKQALNRNIGHILEKEFPLPSIPSEEIERIAEEIGIKVSNENRHMMNNPLGPTYATEQQVREGIEKYYMLQAAIKQNDFSGLSQQGHQGPVV